MDNIEQIAESIANQSTKITVKELEEQLKNNFQSYSLVEIKEKIEELLNMSELYQKEVFKYKDFSIEAKQRILELKKNSIYKSFFELQNMLNNYLNQKLVITSVATSENFQKTIYIVNNSYENLMVETIMGKGNNPYAKLGYDTSKFDTILKNSLTEEENKGLYETAAEIERRYQTYKKRVLWYLGAWKGYKFYTRGPINEAYVNLYIHDIQLNGDMEKNIDTFILDSQYGAIKADATKGLLIGDVSKDGIQYAVKGEFGSPQGVAEVIRELKKIKQEDFSMSSFYNFIYKYTTEEMEKNYKPQIKELSKRSITGVISYYKENLQKCIK